MRRPMRSLLWAWRSPLAVSEDRNQVDCTSEYIACQVALTARGERGS